MKDQTEKVDKSGRKSSGQGSASELPQAFASPACSLHELDAEFNNSGPASDTDHGLATLESVKDWRKQQRKRLLGMRESLSEVQHKVMDSSIIELLESSGWLNKQTGITFYWPMPGEIDLRPMMGRLVAQGVPVALPVITERNAPLEFWRWRPEEALSESGLWGIPAPARRSLLDVSLLLVPMLGFDNEGHRLGFGGGYYDRTIASMQPAPVCVGVCYESGHMHSIFPQDHDMPMHAIVSEKKMRVFNQP